MTHWNSFLFPGNSLTSSLSGLPGNCSVPRCAVTPTHVVDSLHVESLLHARLPLAPPTEPTEGEETADELTNLPGSQTESDGCD